MSSCVCRVKIPIYEKINANGVIPISVVMAFCFQRIFLLKSPRPYDKISTGMVMRRKMRDQKTCFAGTRVSINSYLRNEGYFVRSHSLFVRAIKKETIEPKNHPAIQNTAVRKGPQVTTPKGSKNKLLHTGITTAIMASAVKSSLPSIP
jgi:hypothetical protein